MNVRKPLNQNKATAIAFGLSYSTSNLTNRLDQHTVPDVEKPK